MRNELIPLIGKEVICLGHYSSARHDENCSKHLLKNLKIYPYSQHRQIKTDKPLVRTDHMWVEVNQKLDFNQLIYQESIVVGRVSAYRRSNQSMDLSVVPHLYLNLDDYQAFIYKQEDKKRIADIDISRTRYLLQRMEDAKNQDSRLVSLHIKKTPIDAFYQIKRDLLRLKNSYETELKLGAKEIANIFAKRLKK